MSDSTGRTVSLKCKNIVSRAFCPAVSVTASQDTEELCRELGFNGLLDLLQPFGDSVEGRVTIRDSQAISMNFEDFCIRFLDKLSKNPVFEPGAPGVPGANPSALPLFDIAQLEQKLALYLQQAPEDEAKMYLETVQQLISNNEPTAFETFSHPVAGVIAVSSRNHHPIDTLSTLYRQSHDTSLPGYINRDYLRYYVLVHDETGDDLEKSVALFEQMKRHFGLHCSMIRLKHQKSNDSKDCSEGKSEQEEIQRQKDYVELPYSTWTNESIRAPLPKPLPNPDADELSEPPKITTSDRKLHIEDVASLRTLVRELVTQSIVPFMELCVATWNDQIASSRRGFTGRLFSASRKYFASSSKTTTSILSGASAFGQAAGSTFPFSLGHSSDTAAGTSSGNSVQPSLSSSASSSSANKAHHVIHGNYNATLGFYNYLSPEAQIRKLADFAFMLRDYKFAYTTYELLKRDYLNDKAWHYLAASQEMAAISYLMHSETITTKNRLELVDPLIDSAVYSYISRCSLHSYALRCMLICAELYCTLYTPSAASEGAFKWFLKAMNERLVGHLGYAVLMERLSETCHAYDEIIDELDKLNAGRKSATSSLETLRRPVSESSGIRSFKSDFRPGSSRLRKYAFWQLLAAREWYDTDQHKRALYSTNKAKEIYGELPWALENTGLLGRLEKSLASSPQTSTEKLEQSSK